MASTCEVQVVAASRAAARLALGAAIAEVGRIEAKYSRYRHDSVASFINRSAGGQAVEVDAETAGLLEFGASCHARSAGRFDLTSGVLRRVWTFRPGAKPPSDAEIRKVLDLVGWDKVEWQRPRLRLPRAGMELDFGGIGKEYAADRAAAVCIEHGTRGGIVNLGGDVRVIGPQPSGAPWRFGVAHPRESERVLAGIVLSQGAIATSGDGERYFEFEGTRYCHILDALTGRPVHGGPRSVSVVAPVCIVAGGLSTLAMLMEAQAEPFLEEQAVPYLVVDAQGQVVGSLATRDDGPHPPPPPQAIVLD